VERFAGRNAIVTGGSSGIGRAIVHAFVREGAHVLAVGRDAARLEETRRSSAAPDRVRVGVYDVGVPDQARALVADGIEAFGRVHVLVNDAGIAHYDHVLELPEAHWFETMDVNLHGPFFAGQAAARHMVEHGGGCIVNIASTDAFQVESPQAHYNTSKAALVMMTRSFAHELGHRGIRANCVAPGQTLTPMLGDDMSRPEFVREYLRRIPMRRAADPAEQAAVVLFLASDEASYVNGETIVVDGGQLTGTWYDPALDPPVPTA
jgi:NAD(P)-dependent dehydrogenase (short-subunit alcohol dehydrogenase family)